VVDAPAPEAEEPATHRARRAEALPEDLLQRANRLRAEGAFRAAQERYQEVFRRYPGSLSAYAAQVAAGALALEHLGQPGEARRLFEAALSARPTGALSLEALQGLAASHAALHQPTAERVTLLRLLRAYPDAPAAQRARARLRELDTP
jgi:TolA-binding protein